MNQRPALFHWLTIAAVADWLVGRTFTRSAIFMPKPPSVIAIYAALTTAGQLAFTLTGLLGVACLSWMAWHFWQRERALPLSALLVSLGLLNVAFLFSPPGGWAGIAYHLLLLTGVIALAVQAWRATIAVETRIAVLLPSLALALGKLFQVGPALYAALGWPGPPAFGQLLFNLGELFAVLSPIALWWAYGHGATRPVWFVASLPALAFSAVRLVAPATTGILAIWSTGLTLYLPWPLYTLSFWLAGVTVAASAHRREPAAGRALLLLAAGGYAAQLSSQAFLGLIALALLSSTAGDLRNVGTLKAADTSAIGSRVVVPAHGR